MDFFARLLVEMSHFLLKMYYLVREVDFFPFCVYLNHGMKRGIIPGVLCRFKKFCSGGSLPGASA
jgi:hypothetical protein